MNAKDRSHFKDILDSLVIEINKSLAHSHSSNESISPDNAIGRLTRMEAIQAQSISADGRRRLLARLEMIHAALKSIEDGTYGSCIICESAIQRGRLDFRPESRLCLDCAKRSP